MKIERGRDQSESNALSIDQNTSLYRLLIFCDGQGLCILKEY